VKFLHGGSRWPLTVRFGSVAQRPREGGLMLFLVEIDHVMSVTENGAALYQRVRDRIAR
jgi:hypothetical protein